jgi:type VI secretion system protein ImpA
MRYMDYYQHLLQPVSQTSPCGENLEYDPALILLQAKLQPRLGAEYGGFTEAADPVNWAEVERDCHALLAKSRDIRLVVTLIRCRLRVVGLVSLAEGLQALLALLQQWPEHLYPQLQDEGDFVPLLRANALNELEDSSGLINDLRQHVLPRAVGMQCAIKDVEKAFAIPRDENALPEATVRAMLNEWRNSGHPEMASLGITQSVLQALSQSLHDSLGDIAPGFPQLKHLLELFSGFVPAKRETQGNDEMGHSPQLVEAVSPSPTPPVCVAEVAQELTPLAPQGINSRAQALASLRDVQCWFVAAEPGSPVILLLEFAIKTSGKSFTELMQLLPVEIVAHLNSAGKE